jgi:hypothetical protein
LFIDNEDFHGEPFSGVEFVKRKSFRATNNSWNTGQMVVENSIMEVRPAYLLRDPQSKTLMAPRPRLSVGNPTTN